MKEVQLTQGYVALVDDEDYERVVAAGPWCVEVDPRNNGAIKNVYVKRSAYNAVGLRTNQKLHRFLLGIENPKIQVDHFPDPSGLNNQKKNLRLATNTENSRNRRLGYNNTSGYKGVDWHKRAHKWRASIKVLGKKKHLGLYSLIEEAARAYDEAAKRLFGEFAKTNF